MICKLYGNLVNKRTIPDYMFVDVTMIHTGFVNLHYDRAKQCIRSLCMDVYVTIVKLLWFCLYSASKERTPQGFLQE